MTELEYGNYGSYGPDDLPMSEYTNQDGLDDCEGQESLAFVACGTLTAPGVLNLCYEQQITQQCADHWSEHW